MVIQCLGQVFSFLNSIAASASTVSTHRPKRTIHFILHCRPHWCTVYSTLVLREWTKNCTRSCTNPTVFNTHTDIKVITSTKVRCDEHHMLDGFNFKPQGLQTLNLFQTWDKLVCWAGWWLTTSHLTPYTSWHWISGLSEALRGHIYCACCCVLCYCCYSIWKGPSHAAFINQWGSFCPRCIPNWELLQFPLRFIWHFARFSVLQWYIASGGMISKKWNCSSISICSRECCTPNDIIYSWKKL